MSHRDLTDEQFEQLFEQRKLDVALFSHEAHLRLAWIHLRKYGLEKALENIQTQILAFVKHVGAEDKYDAALTKAAVHAVNTRMARSNKDDFDSFLAAFPELTSDFKNAVQPHMIQ